MNKSSFYQLPMSAKGKPVLSDPSPTQSLPATAADRAKVVLQDAIEANWPAGTQLPPLKDLAVEMGLGHRTLLAAVAKLREEGWVQSAPRRGTWVCDPANRNTAGNTTVSTAIARGVEGMTASILVAHPATDGFALSIANTIRQELVHAGMKVQIRLEPQAEDLEINDLSRHGGDAVCIVNPSANPYIRFAASQTLLAISTAPEIRIQASGGFDFITIDQVQGAAIAGEHLRKIGCKAVAYLGVGREGQTVHKFDVISTARLNGLEQGLGEAIEPQWQLVCKHYDYDSAALMVRNYLQMAKRPDGIFAASDELAVGFVIGAAAHGLTAGRDYQIIGFDGQPAGQKIASGPLTTIDVHPHELGVAGAAMLLERLAKKTVPQPSYSHGWLASFR